jgi:phosphohistidine phosphatase
MRLYLVRHGEAVDEEMDPQRPLTRRGREGVEKVGRFLKPLEISVGAIWHSNKLRAAETAQILADFVTSAGGVVERKGLSPMDPVEPMKEFIEETDEDLMVVGHLPFLGRLASMLILGNDQKGIVVFEEATALCLEGIHNGSWQILWMVTPQILP